jgi:hypothetical protein
MKVSSSAGVLAMAVVGIGLLSTVNAADSGRVVAIGVLMRVDPITTEKAKAVNQQLRKAYPQGYSFDAAHIPHITLVQRFVRAQDIEALSAAVEKVIQAEPRTDLAAPVTGFRTTSWGDVSLLAFQINVYPELQAFEQRIVDAVQPFAVSGGTADAFAVAAGDLPVGKATISAVEEFVPASSGKNFAPHVTLGAAPKEVVDGLSAKQFEKFTIKPAGVAIYQLGNFGTAQKELWPLK